MTAGPFVNRDDVSKALEEMQRKGFYRQDFHWNVSFVQDVTINLLGFIPFGFFFSAFLIKTTNPRRGVSYFIVAMVGAGLSLSIELIQAWLPTRDSSLIDLICNSIGTILGIVTFQVFRKE